MFVFFGHPLNYVIQARYKKEKEVNVVSFSGQVRKNFSNKMLVDVSSLNIVITSTYKKRTM